MNSESKHILKASGTQTHVQMNSYTSFWSTSELTNVVPSVNLKEQIQSVRDWAQILTLYIFEEQSEKY
jgi:hypothetical protein